MLHGKIESPKLIEHRRAENLSQFTEGLKASFFPANRVSDNDRLLGLEQPANRLVKTFLGRLQRQRRGITIQGWEGHFAFELLLLNVAIVADVNRRLWLRRRQSISPNKRIGNRFDACRLIVPLNKVANEISLHQRGMHRRGHRPALGPGIAMRQSDGDLLMGAEDNLRRMIAAIID